MYADQCSWFCMRQNFQITRIAKSAHVHVTRWRPAPNTAPYHSCPFRPVSLVLQSLCIQKFSIQARPQRLHARSLHSRQSIRHRSRSHRRDKHPMSHLSRRLRHHHRLQQSLFAAFCTAKPPPVDNAAQTARSAPPGSPPKNPSAIRG